MGYVVRRLGSGVCLLLALTFITYAVFFLIPTNPACLAVDCGPKNQTTPAQLRAVEHRLGLDQPVVVQYGKFLWRLVRHGSFGDSYGGKPVGPILSAGLPVTASLVLGGALLLVLLALPLGAISAVRPHGLLDRLAFAFSLLGVAMHPFLVAIVLRALLVGHLHLQTGYYCSPTGGSGCGGPLDWARGMLLPWLVFALFFLPLYTRMFRAHLLQTLGERYIQVARAKGASQLRILYAHAFRNALVPILPMLAIDVGTALTTAIYVETVFHLNGLGTAAVEALSGEAGGYDLPTIAGIVFVIAAAVVVLNLIADLALLALDPRITGRAGRHSLWRRQDGRWHRPRLVLAATALAAIAAAGGAVAATHRPGSESQTGPPLAFFLADARTISSNWSEQLTDPQQHGSVGLDVERITLGRHGWTARATITNHTGTTLDIIDWRSFSYLSNATPIDAGFSLYFVTRERDASGIYSRKTNALRAVTFTPALPDELEPDASWSGTFAGPGKPPPGISTQLTVGFFRPEKYPGKYPPHYSLASTKTFRR